MAIVTNRQLNPDRRRAPLAAALAILISALSIPMPSAALDLDKLPMNCRLDCWNFQNGLPARRVEAMTQTRDGFLWLATRGGVVRFDGKSFVICNYKNTRHFFRDMATSIAAGPRSVPWIGTDGGGCGPLQDGVFRPIKLSQGKQLWTQQNAICVARDRSIWIGGIGEYPLIHVLPQHVRAYPEDTPLGRLAQGCVGLTEDNRGTIWILAWSGLLRVQADGSPQTVLPVSDPTALLAAPDGTLWIGSRHGLLHIQGAERRAYHVSDGLPSNDIRSQCMDRDGSLWIGTPAGLGRLHGARISVYTRENGLNDNNIGPILEDREGSLWIATDAGLNRLAHTKLTPIPFRSDHGEAPLIQQPCEGKDGTVWFPSNLGIYPVHGYTPETACQMDRRIGAVRTLATERDGAILFTDSNGDLYRWRNGHVTPIKAGLQIEHLAKDSTGVVAVTRDHWVWHCSGPLMTRQYRLCDFTWCFRCFVDSHDVLWLATTSGLVQGDHGRWKLFHTGLPDDTHVLCVSKGSDGGLWLGTDHGVARFRNGEFHLYGTANGLPDNNIYVAQEDGIGRLWIGGTRGLIAIQLAALVEINAGKTHRMDFTLYDDADGVRQFPVTGGQLRTRDGRLWFTGEKGVTVVDPKRIRQNLVVPTVVLERAAADGMPLNTGQEASLAAGTQNLEFCYTGTSLAAPERVSFRYRLLGYDKNWIDAGSRRAAYYTNLPPGHYRFDVITCNSDGYWSPTRASCEFSIQPFIWQTDWFVTGCLLIVTAGIWGGVRLRLAGLKNRNGELERRVEQRTAELNTSVTELHASKEMLEAANRELQRSREELVIYNRELAGINNELETANDRLEALATTDGMTGIANHRAFQDQMRAALAVAQRTETRTTLLLCDVDHFKQYNDGFGHPAGDEVLRHVARILTRSVREGDLVARYGGEEFAVLLPNTGEAEALCVAQRLRAAVERYPFPKRTVTISIGGSSPMGGAASPQCLVESADRALYTAKHTGRNRVVMAAGPNAGPFMFEASAPVRSGAASESAVEHDDIAELANGLLRVLNLRDAETNGHSQRVARFTIHLARHAEQKGLHRFTEEEMRNLALGALLHDIGKVGISDAILYKPASLTTEEWEVMRSHPLLGAQVIRGCPHFSGAMPIVRSHHERWDGEGYPDRLSGEQIPLGARIFALADTLDAMSTNRPYRQALDPSVIREEILRMSGRQFDPDLVAVFLSVPPEVWAELAQCETVNSGSRTTNPTIANPKAA